MATPDRVTLGDPSVASRACQGCTVVGSPHRRLLFAEAERLGLMASGATLSGSLGQVLSSAAQQDLAQLLVDIQAGGVSLLQGGGQTLVAVDAKRILEASGGLSDQHLVAKGPHMAHIQVKDLADLEALEGVAVQRDPGSVPRPDVARHALDLDNAGVSFLLTDRDTGGGFEGEFWASKALCRPVGAYGAYKALTAPSPDPHANGVLYETIPDSQRLWVAHPAASSFWVLKEDEYPVQVQSVEDLEAAAFFEAGDPSPALDRDPLAVSLREMSHRGYTFHTPDAGKSSRKHTAFSVWKNLRTQPSSPITVGVRGAGQESVIVDQLRDSSTLSDNLQALNRAYEEHVAARLGDGRLSGQDADTWMEAIATPLGTATVQERADLIESAYQFEGGQSRNPSVQATLAAKDLCIVGRTCGPGEEPKRVLAELEELRSRSVRPDVVEDVQKYFRTRLPVITVDPQDFQEEREKVVQIAGLGASFEETLQASELIAYTAQSFADGLRLLQEAVSLGQGLTSPSTPSDAGTAGNGDAQKTPFDNAMRDYKLILAHRLPGEEPAVAASILRAIHGALVPAVGWERSRETFVFLQRLSAHKAFGDRSRDEVVNDFLEAFMWHKDLEEACRKVLDSSSPGARPAATITTEANGDVVIGGIRIKPRKP